MWVRVQVEGWTLTGAGRRLVQPASLAGGWTTKCFADWVSTGLCRGFNRGVYEVVVVDI